MKKDSYIAMQYRYKIEMTYLNIKKGVNTEILNESVKSVIIDHNYDKNTMPIIYMTLALDKALIDDMILNNNDNLILLAIYKFDELTDTKQEIEIIRDKFIYFLPNDVNVLNDIEYNETTEEQNLGNTYKDITLGLMSIKMINRNKKYLELNVTNNTMFDCVKYCTSHFDNLIIEPFIFNEKHKRIIMPAQGSVRKSLEFLNSYRVFYYTPFRYYQDFNYTYIISSSGRAIERNDETYSSVLVEIKDITESDANEFGTIANKSAKTYEVFVNYADTVVYDNTILNLSRNQLKGVSSTGNNIKSLKNSISYSDEKIKQIRLNNDNDNMIYNLQSEENNKNVLVFLTKYGLDTDTFTINKRISIHHINRYQQHNGEYLLYRKRECFMREDDTFILHTMLNLRKIESNYEPIISPNKI
jgi:hypothetical protein